MAALDFPPSSESPFIAPNGVVYFWNDDGFWEADTSEVPTSDNTFLKLDASNDPVTGSLNITGDLDITGKMTSASTGAGDGGTTVVTKDFINGNGGTGSIGYWDRSGTSLSPVNGGDSVLIGGTLPGAPNIELQASGNAFFRSSQDPASQVVMGNFSSGGVAPFGKALTVTLNGTKTSGTGSNNKLFCVEDSDGDIFRVRVDRTAYLKGDLTTDGSATFAGTLEALTTGDYTSKSAFKINSNGLIHCYRPTTSGALQQWFSGSPGGSQESAISFYGGGSADFQGDIGIGGTLPAAPNITLNADGSANFAGGIDTTSTTNNGARIGPSGNITIQRSTDNTAYQIYNQTSLKSLQKASGTLLIGGTINSANDTANVVLNQDGSATFAGKVEAPRIGSTPGLIYFPGASIPAGLSSNSTYIYNGSGSNDDGTYFANTPFAGADDLTALMANDGSFRLGGTLPSAPNISLNADGSASFAAETVNVNLVGNQSRLEIKRTATGKAFTVYDNSADAESIEFLGDGSATFAGNMLLSADGTYANDAKPGVNTSINGTRAVINIKNPSTYTSGSVFAVQEDGYGQANQRLHIYSDGTLKIGSNASPYNWRTILNSDGSATFAGDITAGNVTFDADTADAINVRDRLVEARETFEQLKAAVNGASDFAGLKSALLTALADFS